MTIQYSSIASSSTGTLQIAFPTTTSVCLCTNDRCVTKVCSTATNTWTTPFALNSTQQFNTGFTVSGLNALAIYGLGISSYNYLDVTLKYTSSEGDAIIASSSGQNTANYHCSVASNAGGTSFIGGNGIDNPCASVQNETLMSGL